MTESDRWDSLIGTMNALAICLSVGLLIGGGKPPETPAPTPTPVGQEQNCDKIDAPFIYGLKTISVSTCAVASNCSNANVSIVSQLEEVVCKQQDNRICEPGTCSAQKKCRAQASTRHTTGVTITNLVSTPDPTCPAGQARCTANVVMAEKGHIGCYCMCENK